jgi:hypothetical protein
MLADRVTFYHKRKQQVLRSKFQGIIAATANWEYIAKRQASFREELQVLEKLISIHYQSD